MIHARLPLLLCLISLLAACAPQPGKDLPPYGASVRHMMQAQTYREGDQPPALQGDKAVRNMDAYRRGQRTPGLSTGSSSMAP
ncbi:hypothetical protein DFO67_110106 [Modicisalibacter xianhensis]|uniref:Lipoprotein n=1 Tax=Modicisalibacter xianhensis TaxID=442341 RepID=A0A4R8FPL9_9GAMM|nr:hypothetical protein [Halomonas xianhensis]TDX28406.1 hypothetical protein DFO67_110106 [Halomonas xianhensis]